MDRLTPHEQAVIKFLQRDAKKDDFEFNITVLVELGMYLGEVHEKAFEKALSSLETAGYITKVFEGHELFRLTDKGQNYQVDEKIALEYV